MLDDQEFRLQSDLTLNHAFKKLSAASDDHDFEADLNNGALTIEFEEPPAKFVVSPNAPVRQIWVSASSKSFKLEWDASAGAFLLPGTGQTLLALLSQHISNHLGESVSLA